MPKSRYLATAAGLFAATFASPLMAQVVNQAITPTSDAPSAPAKTEATTAVSDQTIGDIVVTAQRRSERLQDVPIAVSAVTSASLSNAGIRNTQDLRIAVPTLFTQVGNGYLYLKLRGVGADAAGPGLENSVASYTDGVYIGSQSGAMQSFGDIERVEVLKGPQGTLFGRNATGGLIQVVTRNPQQNFGGNVEAGYGNYETFSSKGYLTGGLGSRAEIGVGYFVTTQGEGWGKNLYDGKDAYRLDHDYGFRGKLVLHPGDLTKITISGDYSNTAGSITAASVLRGAVGVYTQQVQIYPSYHDIDVNHVPFVRQDGGGGSIKLEQDLGFANFVDIAAYRRFQARRQLDLDLSPLPIAWFPNNDQLDKQFSDEVQLLSKSKGPLKWTVGAYYFLGSGYYNPEQVNVEAADLFDTIESRVRTVSYAGYGQGTYAFGSQTNLTLGMRYTSETKQLDGNEVVEAGGISTTVASASDRKVEANKITYRASLDHHFDQNIMAYLSVNRGFKSGGWNPSLLTADPFKPETLDAYEGGIKSQLFERHLTLNVAAFYYKYSNIQISTFQGLGQIAIVNGPRAKIYGLDTDFSARVSDNFSIGGGFQLLNANFKDYPDCVIASTKGRPLVQGNCSGNRLPNDAKFILSVAPRYTMPLSETSKFEFGATWYYNSGFFLAADNVPQQSAFSEIAADIKWSSTATRLSASLWGKNLNNSHSISGSAEVPSGDIYTQYSAPRTYGFTVGYKF